MRRLVRLFSILNRLNRYVNSFINALQSNLCLICSLQANEQIIQCSGDLPESVILVERSARLQIAVRNLNVCLQNLLNAHFELTFLF